MAIHKVEYKRENQGTYFDRKTGKFIGWRIDVRVNKKRHRNKRFPTKAEAQLFIDNLKMQHKYRKAGLKFIPSNLVPKLSEFFDRRLSQVEQPSEKIRSKRVFEYFQNLFESDAPVTEVRKPHFQKYINARLSDGVKPETVNREITVLSSAFNRASELYPDELEDFEPPKIVRPKCRKKSRNRVITENEINLICASILTGAKKTENVNAQRSRPVIEKMLRLAWLLGLRYGEVEALKKSDYKPEEKRLTVYRSKTDTLTEMEFLPEVVTELLDEAVRESETEFIFNLQCSRATLYNILRKACEANSIEYGRDKIGGLTFHSTRHSFTTRLVQVTDVATAASFSGHSDKEMVLYYSHASDASRRKAMQKLYGQKQDLSDEDLLNIYDRLTKGEMSFAEFKDFARS